MAIIVYTETTAGAPTLSGTNGALVAILDIALLLNGWAIEYTSGNIRVYRPGTGNRFRVWVQDDSGVSGDARACTIRGCENATSATATVDPFPLTTQVADNQQFILKSITANSTARNYTVYVSPTWFRIFTNPSGIAATGWEGFRFGDTANAYSGDTYATSCSSRNSTSLTANNNGAFVFATSGLHYWCRTMDGAIKSSIGVINCPAIAGVSYAVSGQIGLLAQPFNGAGSTIDGEKLSMYDFYSQTTTHGVTPVYKRGWVQNTYAPAHAGNTGVASRQTWDNGSTASFIAYACAANNWLIQEESDTWVQPT